jgi:hypothetical protein
MTNFYEEHIARLSLLNTGDHPAVSMFIPLRNSELFPNKIFFALIKATNSILQKEGYSKLEIVQPNWNDWAEARFGRSLPSFLFLNNPQQRLAHNFK